MNDAPNILVMEGHSAGPVRRMMGVLITVVLVMGVSMPTEAQADEWSRADLAGSPYAGSQAVSLARGLPRILSGEAPGEIIYRRCDGGCGRASSWASAVIVTGAQLGGADLEVDAWGRPRAVYTDWAANALYYLQCDHECQRTESWMRVRLAAVDRPFQGETISLAVDRWGRPRVAYATKASPAGTYFALCDVDCHRPERWNRVKVADGGRVPSLGFDDDRPRIVFADQARGGEVLRYAGCDDDCLDARAWRSSEVGGVVESLETLSFVQDGPRAHVAYNTRGSSQRIAYATCADSCEQPASWSIPVAVPTKGGALSPPRLAVGGGVHRILYSECEDCGSALGEQGARLRLVRCDATCSSSGNWRWESMPDAGTHAEAGGIAVDGQRPRVVYSAGDSGSPHLHYMACDASCGTAGRWPDPPSEPAPTTTTLPWSSDAGTGTSADDGSAAGSDVHDDSEPGASSQGGPHDATDGSSNSRPVQVAGKRNGALGVGTPGNEMTLEPGALPEGEGALGGMSPLLAIALFASPGLFLLAIRVRRRGFDFLNRHLRDRST